MTTPAKQYQNVSYKELISFAETNPNRNRTLASIEVQTSKPSQETSLDKLGLKGYTAFNLNPTGIISLFACIANPSYYSLAPKNVRTQEIIELATKLQEETENLKNTSLSRKRKKIHDLIGQAYNGANFDDKECFDIVNGLAFMRNTHFVLMKSAVHDDIEEGEKTQHETGHKGEIIFSSDPSLWSSENPIWVADYRARWVAIPSEQSAEPIRRILPNWLTTVEQTGWIIQWPEVDGTKTELVERLSVLPTWQATDKKLTKEILAARLGRANTIKLFTKWMIGDNETL